VTAVARNPDDHDWLRRQGARPVEVDLFDQLAVSAAVDGHDVVVHMATSIPPQNKMSKRKAWTMNDRLRAVATSIQVDTALALDVEAFIQSSPPSALQPVSSTSPTTRRSPSGKSWRYWPRRSGSSRQGNLPRWLARAVVGPAANME